MNRRLLLLAAAILLLPAILAGCTSSPAPKPAPKSSAPAPSSSAPTHTITPSPTPRHHYTGTGGSTRPLLCQRAHGQLVVPVKPYVVSQGYTGPYPRHSGIDLAGPNGNIVHTVAAGRVIGIWYWSYSYGRHVLVQNHCGQTLYAHLQTIWVHNGQHLDRRQSIGRRDSTGNSTGPHLHFEIIKHGYPVNPAPWLWRYGTGGAMSPKAGHDTASKLINPVYDWRTSTEFEQEVQADFNVARAAVNPNTPTVEHDNCLQLAVVRELQRVLPTDASGMNMTTGNVAAIAQHCHMRDVEEIVGHGTRTPGYLVYQWLHGSFAIPNGQQASTAHTRGIVLNPSFMTFAAASAVRNGQRHEVLLVGTRQLGGLPPR